MPYRSPGVLPSDDLLPSYEEFLAYERERKITEVCARWSLIYPLLMIDANAHITQPLHLTFTNRLRSRLTAVISKTIFAFESDFNVIKEAGERIVTAFKSQSWDTEPAEYLIYGILCYLLFENRRFGYSPDRNAPEQIEHLRFASYCFINSGERELAKRTAEQLHRYAPTVFDADIASTAQNQSFNVYQHFLRRLVQPQGLLEQEALSDTQATTPPEVIHPVADSAFSSVITQAPRISPESLPQQCSIRLSPVTKLFRRSEERALSTHDIDSQPMSSKYL